MRLFEITCAISAICLCFSLRAAIQDPPQRKPPTKATNDKIVEEMQGAWRLVTMDSPVLKKDQRTEVGFLIVTGNYFSFELHIGWSGPEGKPGQRIFQSGTHRFELDARIHMTATAVIGAISDPEGHVLFEQPGHKREYDVDCSATRLTLKRDDGTSLEFERMADTRVKRDFYGRPIKPKETDGAGKDTDGAGKDGNGVGKDGKDTPPKKD